MSLGLTDVTVVFGQRGCGKSTLARRLAEIYPRKVVFDPMKEWGNEPNAKFFSDFESFCALWAELYDQASFTLVYHRVPGTSMENAASDFSGILGVIHATGETDPGNYGVCLVLEEFQFLAPVHSLDAWLGECVFTGRHAGTAIIASTQRPASIHKSFVSQASHIFVGKLFEARDIAYLRETIGDDAFKARDLPRFQFLWVIPGEVTKIIDL